MNLWLIHSYLSLLFVPEFSKDRSDSLALRVPNCTQTVSSVRPSHETWDVRNDKPQAGTTSGSEVRPPRSPILDLWSQELNHNNETHDAIVRLGAPRVPVTWSNQK